MAWFKKTRKPIATPAKEKASRVPEGLWVKCPGCSQVIYNKDLAANLNVCPKCAHHFRINAAERLRMLFDGDWTEFDKDLVSTDPLNFTDTKPYKSRLKASIASTGMKDAVIVATGTVEGVPTVIASMEYGFIGGSMGVVVGEKIARGIERAIAERMPVVIVCCSGGARMMEGALSLMQMAKICGALARLDRQKLPEGFQRSEFLLEKGMLDLVVDRREMKATIANALRFMGATAVVSPQSTVVSPQSSVSETTEPSAINDQPSAISH